MARQLVLALVVLAACHSIADAQLGEIVRAVSNFIGGGGEPRKGGAAADGIENVPYTVTNSYRGYEERFYPGARWACTRGDGDGSMFMKLFGYISGSNARGSKIEMTAPVMTHVQGQGSKLSKNMCFYVPRQFQNNPPAPTDRAVRIETVAPMTVVVKTMGGYPDMDAEARKFRQELGGQAGIDFSSYYSMGYNSPMEIFNRRNEVMFRKN